MLQSENLNMHEDCEGCKNVSRDDEHQEKWACILCGREFIPIEYIQAWIEDLEYRLERPYDR